MTSTAVDPACLFNFSCFNTHWHTHHCTSLPADSLDQTLIILSVVISILIVILNTTILATYRSRYCRTPINGLVYGLCLEDMITAVLIIPMFIASFYSPGSFLSHLCNLYGMAVVFMILASGSTVSLICVLQTYAYLNPLSFKCHIRTRSLRFSSAIRYLAIVLFLLPCSFFADSYFQFEENGHLCVWNYNGQLATGPFTYTKFATVFSALFGVLQIFVMSISVAVAIYLLTKASLVSHQHHHHCHHKDKSTTGNRSKIRSLRAKGPNLAEGLLLSASYLFGVSLLLTTQINDYLLPTEYQVGFMMKCNEWNLFKTVSVFLTSLFNQFAIGLKNRRIRNQIRNDCYCGSALPRTMSLSISMNTVSFISEPPISSHVRQRIG